MATNGVRSDALDGDDRKHLAVSDCQITEAGLGRPLIDRAGNFVGVNIHCDCDTGKTWFLPSTSLRERLEHFEILTPRNMQGGHNPYGSGFSSGKNKKHRSESYSPPSGVSRVIPSGFMKTWKWLESTGYPKPPPLMLELNGELRNKFEVFFGWIHTPNTYTGFVPLGYGKNPWLRLDGYMIRTITRYVVSLASFNGNTRFFTCTGFLVKCPSKSGRMQTVIVTSASLVRTDVAEDTIDENLKIEVFLPPYQRFNGTLESYHLSYNVAIVSVKGLHCIRPQDILSQQKPLPGMVAAIGRHPTGVLCGSLGKVTGKPRRFGWEDLGLSTCTIKKAGIGGPLINIADGCLVGMNFYDGRTGRTPFLPWIKICEVLNLFASNFSSGRSDDIMSGRDHCVRRLDEPNELNLNKWPVPRPYWYHGLLEVDIFDPLRMAGRGRILD